MQNLLFWLQTLESVCTFFCQNGCISDEAPGADRSAGCEDWDALQEPGDCVGAESS